MPGKPPAISPPPESATTATGGSTRSVERALALLATVCGGQASSLAECARLTGLPASTALRLLRTLEQVEFVARDDETGGYRAGARMVQLGAQALGHEQLIPLCAPALQNIVGATGESAYLSVRGPGATSLYVSIVEGTHSIRHTSWVGRTVPLEGSAVGTVLLDRVPDRGYVVLRSGVEPDVTAIAAPIRRPGGVAGALSIVGPDYRLGQEAAEHHGRLLAREAAAVARSLGVEQNSA
jgi:IclR family transcriptional regulator, acetate operon repressor